MELPRSLGVVARWSPLTPADLGALASLYRAARLADDEPDEVLSPAELEEEHFLAPGSDPGVDSLGGWSASGDLLCWASVWCRPVVVTTARAVLRGDVHPRSRRRGLGTALLGWQVGRALTRLDGEAPPSLPRRIDMYAPEGAVDRAALARAHGLMPERWWLKMSRPAKPLPAPPPLPDGVRVEAWSPSRDGATRDAWNDAFRDHYGFEPIPEASWRHRFTESAQALPERSLLALAGERVVGFVLCSQQEVRGQDGARTAWLESIGVRRADRGRGLATALIARVLAGLAATGFDSVALEVDADSHTGAASLYERLGFRTVRRTVMHARWLPPVAEPGSADRDRPHATDEAPEPGAPTGR